MADSPCCEALPACHWARLSGRLDGAGQARSFLPGRRAGRWHVCRDQSLVAPSLPSQEACPGRLGGLLSGRAGDCACSVLPWLGRLKLSKLSGTGGPPSKAACSPCLAKASRGSTPHSQRLRFLRVFAGNRPQRPAEAPGPAGPFRRGLALRAHLPVPGNQVGRTRLVLLVGARNVLADFRAPGILINKAHGGRGRDFMR